MTIPPIEENVRRLLELVAEEQRPCKACGVDLFFVRHRNGKRAPYTADAVNHFINCKDAAQFKVPRKAG